MQLLRKAGDFHPEIWAGAECSINRVGNHYFNQLIRTGHYNRLEDFYLLADLGINKLRFPVLWEQVASIDGSLNFNWCDERIQILNQLKIEPIAGLLHHGSGPSFTDLMDDNFPEKLAAYAKNVAQRYPFINYYTPVNEPLTTARFSGLYGLWYPNKMDDYTFLKTLINQLKGIILSMKEIHKINPRATLIQTEDLAKTYSTPSLKNQCVFDNERRWLTYDMLTGKMDKHHYLWGYFMKSGIKKEELDLFSYNSNGNLIMGFNYYITSERFIDGRLYKYPEHLHGGNAKNPYADVEAVRAGKLGGLKKLLGEAWRRYKIPIAVTELFMSCTREEQLKWVDYIFNECAGAYSYNVDIRAITFWSLFGSYNWHNLLTKEENKYDPGLFDVRSSPPRPTALVTKLKQLHNRSDVKHPAASSNGWWLKNDCFTYKLPAINKSVHTNKSTLKPILITGNGTLGNVFARICEVRNQAYILLPRSKMDIADAQSVNRVIEESHPWAIINTAGYVKVDDAETNEDQCYRENLNGPSILSTCSNEQEIKFVTFSSDLVFNGNKKDPYIESNATSPINVYGKSKSAAELIVQKNDPNALIIRTSAFFSPWDQHNFIYTMHNAYLLKYNFNAADDIRISPTYVPDLANTVLDLLIDDEKGVWHLSSYGDVTWAEFAKLACTYLDISSSHIYEQHASDFNFTAKRPGYSVLNSEKGRIMPTLEEGLYKYARELRN